ncbi:hypothetical protein ACHAWF_005383, partial [Thalassiosira exigua]
KPRSFRPDLVLDTADSGRECDEGGEDCQTNRANCSIEAEGDKNMSCGKSKSGMQSFMLRVGHPKSTAGMTEAERREITVVIETAAALAITILENSMKGAFPGAGPHSFSPATTARRTM